MATLVSFPGRAGDILWALPTVRAISEHVGEPVDFGCCGEFEGLAGVIAQQPYIGCVRTSDSWGLTPPNEWNPPEGLWTSSAWRYRYDRVYHLGYRGWPTYPLAQNTLVTAMAYYPELAGANLQIDLTRPWIQVKGGLSRPDTLVAWTEEWIELKMGLLAALPMGLSKFHLLYPPGARHEEWRERFDWAVFDPTAWLDVAQWLSGAPVLLADCSAPHVLAVAMGVPVVLVEPSEARRNPIFQPVGVDGPQVTIVRGVDNQPTWDARAVADTLQRVLCAPRREPE